MIRAQAAVWRASHRPVSRGLMRPSGTTAVASTMSRPKPPTARAA